MRYRRILPVVSALAVVLAVHPVTLRSQALQRSMIVSVTDQSGAAVSDLGPADFIIREDNVSREVLRVAPATDPMQIAILIDNSTSAREEIQNIRRALPGFLDVLTIPTSSGRKNEIAILGISERPTILADVTTDRAQLQKAIGLIWEQQPPSGAYLLDAIVEVVQGFKKREAARPVIVAIATDGPDPSARDYLQVLTPLRDSGTTLHVISLGRPSPDFISDDGRNRARVIDEGPTVSGGVKDRLLTGNGLPAKLQQFGEVLTHQYVVTYSHPDSLIPPERVVVSARKTGLTARGVLRKDPQARQ